MERTFNPCDECPYGIDMRDGSGNDAMCKICEFRTITDGTADLIVRNNRLQEQLVAAQLTGNRMAKAFALACRFIADNMDCPGNEVNAEFPACKRSADEEYQNDAPHGTCEDGGWLCWQKYILEQVDTEPVCRICGCTENNACTDEHGDTCYWVEPDLCSACAEAAQAGEEKDDGNQIV